MPEKRLHAGLWDQMHFMLRRYNDGMTHTLLRYEGTVRVELLSQALKYIIDSAPVLHSSFCSDPMRPFWRVREYSISDVFSVYDTDTPDEDAVAFLLGDIPHGSSVQILVRLYRKGEYNVLAVLANHMCMDGGDFYNFLRLLRLNYNALLAGHPQELRAKTGTRSHRAIYSSLGTKDRLRAHTLWRYRGKIKSSPYFPFAAASPEDRKAIVCREIPDATVSRAAAYAKSRGCTSNDLLIAAALSVLYDMCGHSTEKPLALSCAIDLRRHIKDGGAGTGLTNHAAWLSCAVERHGESFDELLAAVNRSMKQSKDDPFVGMYTLPLLNLGCTVVPFFITQRLVRLIYDNPPLAMSNVGRIRNADITFDGTQMTGGFLTGTTKYKPAFLMTVQRFDAQLMLVTAIRAGDEDIRTVERFFERIEDILAGLE